MEEFKSLKIVRRSATSRVFELYINRPSSRNALSSDFFAELPIALSHLDLNPDAGAILLRGAGDNFCSGIDLKSLASITTVHGGDDRGRSGERLRRGIMAMQEAISAIERCRKPVIACVSGACIGGAVDVITACDVRYCTEEAFFSVKEVDLAITADLGTLQRLPGIVGYGAAMELALTGRTFSALEAKEMGLVSTVFPTKDDMDRAVSLVAEGIASKSPLAVIGTKAVLLRGRDMTMDQGLDYVATWNAGMLLSDDLTEAIQAHVQKRKPVFAKL